MPSSINMLLDIPLTIAVQLGQTQMSVRDLLKLKHGEIVQLKRHSGDFVDVFINQKMLAKGEITVKQNKISVRITSLYGAQERYKQL